MTALTLYQLTGNWLEMANRLSDMDLDPQTIADTIEGSDEQMALEEKAQGYEMVARNFEASIPAIDNEIKRLQDMKKAKQARADALRKRVKDTMLTLGIQKITCPLFELRIQKNPASVEVYEEDLVPKEYWKTPAPVIDKTAIKDALKAGIDVQGARLTQADSLRIK